MHILYSVQAKRPSCPAQFLLFPASQSTDAALGRGLCTQPAGRGQAQPCTVLPLRTGCMGPFLLTQVVGTQMKCPCGHVRVCCHPPPLLAQLLGPAVQQGEANTHHLGGGEGCWQPSVGGRVWCCQLPQQTWGSDKRRAWSGAPGDASCLLRSAPLWAPRALLARPSSSVQGPPPTIGSSPAPTCPLWEALSDQPVQGPRLGLSIFSDTFS